MAKKYNEWFLQLLIGDTVEEEYPITDMSIGGVKALSAQLLDPISFLVNPLIVQKVTDELLAKVTHVLVDFNQQPPKPDNFQSTQSNAIAAQVESDMLNDMADSINLLFQTTQELTEKLSQLEVRLIHLEKITNNLALITDNLLEK